MGERSKYCHKFVSKPQRNINFYSSLEMENRDFIVFGLQAWDMGIGSTCKYTAIELSKNNRVLFVNPPLQRKAIIKGNNSPQVQKRINILKGLEPDLVQVSPTLWVLYPRTVVESINWIPWRWLFSIFNKMNSKRFAAKIREAAKSLGFSDYILFDDNSMILGYYLKELLKPSIFIYLLRDAVTKVAYHKRHGTYLEPAIIAKSDFTVTNSDYFCNFAKQFNDNSYMIGQGCDVTYYSDPDGTLPVPPDISNIPKPIIGYTGFLAAHRLDLQILAHIAEAKPEWNIVLVGPEDDIFKQSNLHQIKNVYFLGRKNPEELAGYVKAFDVAINPQVINDITNCNYPLKIDEYLAMGKPVVATKTLFMDYFKNETYLAKTYPEWVEMISKALAENSPALVARRLQVAGQHTWTNFVGEIYSICEKLDKK